LIARLVIGWIAVASLGGCLDPTQATIEITTNATCGGEGGAASDAQAFHEAGLVAGTSQVVRSAALQTSTDACTEGSNGIATVGSMVLYPRDDARFASLVVVGAIGNVTAEDCLERIRSGSPDVTSCIIAKRSVAFIEHEDLHVPILLDRSCAGVVCGEEETCVVQAGKPACVSAETVCVGNECNPSAGAGGGVTASASVGGGGVGGNGGSGGAGGGNATFEVLPPPSANASTRAFGVSDDGEIVVGVATLPAQTTRPVAWRDDTAHVLGTAAGMGREACGTGELVVGAEKAGGQNVAKAWRWNTGTNTYDTAFTSSLTAETTAVDCDTKGQRLLVMSLDHALLFPTMPAGAAPLGQTTGLAWEMSGNGGVIVGGESTSPAQPEAWNVATDGVIGTPVALPGTPGSAYAVNATGTVVAGYVDSHLVVWALPGPTILYSGDGSDFYPNAIVGSQTNWLAVGACDVFVNSRACVVVNGQGPYDIDGVGWDTVAQVCRGRLPGPLFGERRGRQPERQGHRRRRAEPRHLGDRCVPIAARIAGQR